MAGISSKALNFGAPENKYKYNGYEQNNTFDINLYETFYRSHDPQLGRFWQMDPKPNYGEGLYVAMSNNPVLNFDILGDTVNYKDEIIKNMVLKYTSKNIVNRKGKEVANKDYNEAFAGVIGKLDASVDNFNFSYDANAKEGLVSYDGKDVNVAIGDPGAGYGTDNGAEGILFEETKHAEQFLDGKSRFRFEGGKWHQRAICIMKWKQSYLLQVILILITPTQ